jgi:hypothetical protein
MLSRPANLRLPAHRWDQFGRGVDLGVAEIDGEMLPELGICRAPSRTRTCDLLLRRQPLYPLSYRGSPARQGRRRQAYRLAAAGPSSRGG